MSDPVSTPRSTRLLYRATKATVTVQIDNEPATYLPPILCVTCTKADLPRLLPPQGLLIYELKEETARSDMLTWDLADVRQSARQCRLCELLLKCLEGCTKFDDNTASAAGIFVHLEPLGEYQEMGELTLWMILTGKRPRPTMDEFIRCQLRVGVRMRQNDESLEEAFRRKRLTYSSNNDDSSGSPWNSNLDGSTQQSPAVPFPSDHPPRNRLGTGFIDPNRSQRLISPTCERELSAVPSSLWRHMVLESAFHNVGSALESFWNAVVDPEGARPRSGPSSNHAEGSQGPAGSGSVSSVIVEETSSLSIQSLGRRPIGPIERNSWRYEVDNIMKSRGLECPQADFRLATYWLFVCGLWHAPYCPPLVWTALSSDTFALRVIDVKRHCIAVAPPRCKYAALSYTWGKAKQCTLTLDNLDEMCKPGGMRKHAIELPRTIADALTTCERLSIRYLWVDALCIIQDSPSDKVAQIGSMGFVYGGAYLTIVAGSGNSADAGLPGVSFPRKDQYFQSKISDLDFITSPASGVDNLLRSAWYTRGWTFQELVLSKRILAFTEEQMLFFCVKAFFREDMVLEPINGIFRPAQDMKGFFDRHISVSGRRLDENSGMYTDQALDSYWRFLASYLCRELSNEGDILNAFAGILDALSPYMGTFSWGIPILFPNKMLTWNFRNPSPLRRRAGFPSWSWAGWSGYTGDLLFHKSLSVNSMFSRFDELDSEGPLFYSFLENGDIIPFALVHYDNPEQHSQKWDIIDEDWTHIRPNFGQYLLLITRTVFLVVDAEGKTAERAVDNSDYLHAYSIRWGYIRLGQIYLSPAWRSKQPTELEFVGIGKSVLGESLMLIQRAGPVAHRVQMVDKPVDSVVWSKGKPGLQSIILG